MYNKLQNDLQKLADPQKAKILSRFFKTGKGQYGEGDIFIGIKVPEQRKVAAKYKDLALLDIQKLLHSNIHEYRLTAIIMLVNKYKKSDEAGREEIIKIYRKNTKYINNWDLVDLSAHYTLGDYLLDKPEKIKILFNYAKSSDLWERRIAILSTFAFIRANRFDETLEIATTLLHDDHDLIHKAVGWMLREVGKRDQKTEETFLDKHYKVMPRTMLRYAIERFSDTKRRHYMAK